MVQDGGKAEAGGNLAHLRSSYIHLDAGPLATPKTANPLCAEISVGRPEQEIIFKKELGWTCRGHADHDAPK
jgi:hypothetical protein